MSLTIKEVRELVQNTEEGLTPEQIAEVIQFAFYGRTISNNYERRLNSGQHIKDQVIRKELGEELIEPFRFLDQRLFGKSRTPLLPNSFELRSHSYDSAYIANGLGLRPVGVIIALLHDLLGAKSNSLREALEVGEDISKKFGEAVAHQLYLLTDFSQLALRELQHKLVLNTKPSELVEAIKAEYQKLLENPDYFPLKEHPYNLDYTLRHLVNRLSQNDLNKKIQFDPNYNIFLTLQRELNKPYLETIFRGVKEQLTAKYYDANALEKHWRSTPNPIHIAALGVSYIDRVRSREFGDVVIDLEESLEFLEKLSVLNFMDQHYVIPGVEKSHYNPTQIVKFALLGELELQTEELLKAYQSRRDTKFLPMKQRLGDLQWGIERYKASPMF